MELPWKLRDKLKQKREDIEELETRVEEKEEEKEKWRKRFEAEKDRRSELSRKKQEAEEELNRLEQKLDQKERKVVREEKNEGKEFEKLELDDTKSMLKKLGSIEADERELVTVYSPDGIEDLSDLRELKNSISRDHYERLERMKSFVAFIDSQLGIFLLKSAPLFTEKVEVGGEFEVAGMLEFIGSEKYWCTVSAGESVIYREEDGELEEVGRVKSRVNREHSKGGFSQGRFERKREEQIEQHLDQLKEKLEEFDEVYLLGDERFCEELPGSYLGGLDPNRKKPEQFYRFQFRVFF